MPPSALLNESLNYYNNYICEFLYNYIINVALISPAHYELRIESQNTKNHMVNKNAKRCINCQVSLPTHTYIHNPGQLLDIEFDFTLFIRAN